MGVGVKTELYLTGAVVGNLLLAGGVTSTNPFLEKIFRSSGFSTKPNP